MRKVEKDIVMVNFTVNLARLGYPVKYKSLCHHEGIFLTGSTFKSADFSKADYRP